MKAERAILGSALIDESARFGMLKILRPDDFEDPDLRRIAREIESLSSSGRPVDLVTVSENLGDAGELCYSLISDIEDIGNWKGYAEIVSRRAMKRRVSAMLSSAASSLEESGQNVEAVGQSLIERISGELRERGGEEAGFLPMSHWSGKFVEWLSETKSGMVGPATGFACLDRLINGFCPGDIFVIAGDTGHGKTIFALQIARQMAARGTHVGFVTLEMPWHQIVMRHIEAMTGMTKSEILDSAGFLERMAHIAAATIDLGKLPIHMRDCSSITADSLRSTIREMKKTFPVEVVFVDYLQRMSGRGQNREREVAGISMALKEIARAEKIAMVPLAQFSRPSKEAGYRPTIHRLRDSGQIEQDASAVIGLYWIQDGTGTVEVSVLKNRNGETALFKFREDFKTARFFEEG